jgi:hypothetical protein
MHAAPAVRVTLRGSPGWVAFVAAVAGAGTANAVAWAMLRLELPAALPALAAGMVAGVTAARLSWRARADGHLGWDGERWSWGGQPGLADVALDLGGWMLLRFCAEGGGRRWIAASRRATTGPWAALRAALYWPPPAAPVDAPPA